MWVGLSVPWLCQERPKMTPNSKCPDSFWGWAALPRHVLWITLWHKTNLVSGSLALYAAFLLFIINVLLFIDHIYKEKLKTLQFCRLKLHRELAGRWRKGSLCLLLRGHRDCSAVHGCLVSIYRPQEAPSPPSSLHCCFIVFSKQC